MKFTVYFLLTAGPVFYLCKLPYLFQAWCNSPMDRWDWIALPAAFLAALLAYRNVSVHLRQHPFTPYRLIPLGSGLIFFTAAWIVSVNSFSILAAVAIWWSCCFAALTPGFAVALLPAFLLLCLGCTSSTYWIGYFLSIPTGFVILLKGIIAAVILLISALHIRVRMEQIAFILLFSGGMLALHNADALSRISGPLILFPESGSEHCILRRRPPDPASRRFFRNSRIRFYAIADSSDEYHLLEIREINDIHDIHPASHCLRSGGREILSEKTAAFQIRKRLVPLTLIVTRNPNGKELFAVWYSSSVCSCSTFLTFRRCWTRKQDWHIYQLSIQVKDTVGNARKKLELRISDLASRPQSRSDLL